MINLNDDTIAAVSTAAGDGGIGIVRLSGRDSVRIADRIFVSRDKIKPSKFKSHTIHYGHIVNSPRSGGAKELIDEVLLTVMRSPKTYTKEDVVEINCHGGMVALRRTLEIAVTNGARPAEPGEFTKRAFLNGRLDLAQAEAVLDIIMSKTEAGLRASVNQLEGELSMEVKSVRGGILGVCVDMEAAIDFPEEDIRTDTASGWRKAVKIQRMRLEKLVDTYHDGAVLREGIVAVICGKPNVGKSSLLNLLLKKDRAIVTHIPGTTRDPIEETANVKGIPVRLVDTAGIRREKNIVEREGIRRSHLYLSMADLVICVLDGSDRLKNEDKEILKKIRNRSAVIVANKSDLKQKMRLGEIKKIAANKDIFRISCVTKMGVDKLKDRIYNKIWSGKVSPSGEAMINNIRHKKAIESAIGALRGAEQAIIKKVSLEFAATDMKCAANLLGEVTGEIYTDDVLDVIFSKFCVGK